MWEGSTLLGIGYARNADRTKVYVVARYKPAGNVQASFRNFYQENVKVPAYILDTFQNNCDGTSRFNLLRMWLFKYYYKFLVVQFQMFKKLGCLRSSPSPPLDYHHPSPPQH